MKQLLFASFLFAVCFLYHAPVQAQNATPDISIGLLQAPTAHDCPGIVRVIQSSCGCGFANSGWSVFWAPAPGNTTPSASSGSITFPQNYGTCGNQDTSNVALNPGEYIFTATISPDQAGCHGLNETRTFSISIPANIPCIPPVLQITGTTQETGFGCNNGTISFSGSITQCASTGIIFQLYDSAGNLLQELPRNIFSSTGLQGTVGNLGAGRYTVKAYQPPGISPCPNEAKAEQSVSIITVPVMVNGGANLITETGDGGCQRHKVVCNYNDDFAQKSCSGSGSQTWTATLRGTTTNGKDIIITGTEVFGQSIIFSDVPVGNYTVGCSRSIPGPTQGNTESSIAVPGAGCSSTLTEISRTVTPKGIGCDSAAVIEFAFTSSNCYTTWSMVEAFGQLYGTGGIWSANKGEHIFASVPATYLANSNYQFIAYSNGDPQLDCPATATVTAVPTLGCDGTVTATLSKPISTPGASDGEVSFKLTTSSCLDAPWHVVMKNVLTGTEYVGVGQNKNDTAVVSGLPAGNYTYGFEYIGDCSKPDAGSFSLDCSTMTVYRDNDGDGYGDSNSDTTICSLYLPFLSGYSGNSSDTDDNQITYADSDGDGFGFGNPSPSGVNNNTDLNDNCSACYPGASEICDGVDNDGDGVVDTTYMPGLIVYLPLNGNANDLSSNGLNGTVNGSVTSTTDRFGNANGAMDFPGNINSHIRINDNPLLRPSSITLSAWVRMSSQPGLTGFISKSINCYNDSWHFGSQGSNYSTWVSNSASCGDFVQITSPLSVGNWRHIVFTLDEATDTRNMYVDGNLVATGAYTSSIPYDGNPVLVGGAIENGNLDFPFHGSLDDVMIFNRAITAAEVSSLFNGTSPITVLSKRYYADTDGDGFGNPGISQVACSQPAGFVLNNTDCDDARNVVYPGAPEICDGLDNDCNGLTDSVFVSGGFVCGTASSEGESFILMAPPGKVFNSVDFASYGTPNGSCGNFTLGSCHAGTSMQVIESLVIGRNTVTVTQDYQLFGDPCLGTFKRLYVQASYLNSVPVSQTYYADSDGDGFGNPSEPVALTCGSSAPTELVTNNTDCDDSNSNINPNASAGALSGPSVLCAGQSAPFTSSGTPGGVWLSRNTNVFTINGGGVVNAVANGSAYLVYTVNNCSVNGHADSVLVTVASQYVWTGAGANRNWNNPANWTACGIPPNGSDVIIHDVPNLPLLNVDAMAGNITLNGNATLTLGNQTLTVNGALTGMGSLSSSTESSLVIAGNAGTIRFAIGKDTIKDITLQQNASVTLGNMLYVKAGTQPGVVSLQQGAALNANGNLTLLSNINGTARVAPIPVNGSGAALAAIIGDVVVERHIPKNTYKAWHMLSVPTKGLQTIKQGWQENRNAGVVGTAGYGTTITTAAGFLQNGFDGVTTKTSIQAFNPANGGLINLTSTLNPAETRNGYFIFVRGDRSVPLAGNNNAVNATKLRTKGTLYTGNQSALNSAANRYLMVGNIYPSAIDFTLLTKTGGIGNTYYIWDPKLNNGTSLGGYQTFSATNGYAPTIAGGSYSGPNTTIESGQSFFVYANGTAGTIQMVEAAKTDGNSFNVFRPTAKQAIISVQLLTHVNGEWFTADANTIVFDRSFTDAVTNDDAVKMLNPGENIASSAKDGLFAIEARGNLEEQQFVQYYVSNLHKGKHQLQFDFKTVSATCTEVYLKDAYLDKWVLLNCNTTPAYSFTIDDNAASANPNRFALVFGKKKPAAIYSAEPAISVHPNPSTESYFNLSLVGFTQGPYQLKIWGPKGDLLYLYSGNAVAGNSTTRINLNNRPAPGTCIVEVTDRNNKRFTRPILFR